MKSFLNIVLLLITCFVMTGAALDTCCLDVQDQSLVEIHGEDCHKETKDQEDNSAECNMDCCHSIVSPFNTYKIKSYLSSFEYKYLALTTLKTTKYHPILYRPPIS